MGSVLGGIGEAAGKKKGYGGRLERRAERRGTSVGQEHSRAEKKKDFLAKAFGGGERGLLTQKQANPADALAAATQEDKLQDSANTIATAQGGGAATGGGASRDISSPDRTGALQDVRPGDKRNPNGSPYGSFIGGVFGGF